jgi:hypothetical protein
LSVEFEEDAVGIRLKLKLDSFVKIFAYEAKLDQPFEVVLDIAVARAWD